MADAVWPLSLPSNFLVQNFQETPPDNTIRSKTGIGPGKIRKRATSASRPIMGSQYMSASEVDTLDTFFTDSLEDGSKRFEWTHPRTGANVEMRFKAPPQYTPRGIGWDVLMQLEIMP